MGTGSEELGWGGSECKKKIKVKSSGSECKKEIKVKSSGSENTVTYQLQSQPRELGWLGWHKRKGYHSRLPGGEGLNIRKKLELKAVALKTVLVRVKSIGSETICFTYQLQS